MGCPNRRWSECFGEVAPAFESCNGLDEDCDGLVDEGVLSPCGGCNPECTGGVWGPPVADFEADGDVDVTAAGELTLRLVAHESHTVWVANTGETTLSKIDAVSALEIARYRVAGESPERVAIDHDGDVWVLSPSLEGVSMLTKVAGELERCRDRDGDGLVQTSRSPAELLDLGQDECLLLQVEVGEAGEVARALALDGARAPDAEAGGDVWVGMQVGERLLQLDGADASLLREVPTPDFAAFAATFDPWGLLWLIDRQGLLGRFVPGRTDGALEVIEAPLRCYELEALASDQAGRLTLTGFACEDVLFYDPPRDRWRSVKTEGVLDARGVTVLGERSWVAHTGGMLSRARRDPPAIEATFSLASEGLAPLESIATGADSLGMVWVVSSQGGPGGAGLATRFDPELEQVTAQVPVGMAPRAQGDITGDRRFGTFVPEASTSHVFEGCGLVRRGDAGRLALPTDWKRLQLAATYGPGASVLVEARHAVDQDALADAPFQVIATAPADEPPYELPFEEGGVIEVRLTLRVAGRLGAPRVARVGVEWACAGPD
jgi:streptogramin lyase